MNLLHIIQDEQFQARKNRINGVVVGIVTNNEDPENMGRVKVRFPWLSDENESGWARISTLMAGSERGVFFLPELDDEVLVAFEQGDIRYPYVIGSLWNGKDPPPEKNEGGKNNVRLIKSRSGHIMRFNDEEGKEKIEIIDKSGNNKIVIDTSNNTLSIATDNDIMLTASNGRILLDAQNIEIRSTQDITIEASKTATIIGHTLVDINP